MAPKRPFKRRTLQRPHLPSNARAAAQDIRNVAQVHRAEDRTGAAVSFGSGNGRFVLWFRALNGWGAM